MRRQFIAPNHTPDGVRPPAERTERRKRQRCSFSLTVASLQAGAMPAPKLITMEEKKRLGGELFCCWLACSSEAFLLSNIFAGPDLLLGSISATVMFHSVHRRHDIIVTIGPNLTSTFKLQLDFHKATGGIHHRTYNSTHKVLKVCVCQRGFQCNHS